MKNLFIFIFLIFFSLHYSLHTYAGKKGSTKFPCPHVTVFTKVTDGRSEETFYKCTKLCATIGGLRRHHKITHHEEIDKCSSAVDSCRNTLDQLNVNGQNRKYKARQRPKHSNVESQFKTSTQRATIAGVEQINHVLQQTTLPQPCPASSASSHLHEYRPYSTFFESLDLDQISAHHNSTLSGTLPTSASRGPSTTTHNAPNPLEVIGELPSKDECGMDKITDEEANKLNENKETAQISTHQSSTHQIPSLPIVTEEQKIEQQPASTYSFSAAQSQQFSQIPIHHPQPMAPRSFVEEEQKLAQQVAPTPLFSSTQAQLSQLAQLQAQLFAQEQLQEITKTQVQQINQRLTDERNFASGQERQFTSTFQYIQQLQQLQITLSNPLAQAHQFLLQQHTQKLLNQREYVRQISQERIRVAYEEAQLAQQVAQSAEMLLQLAKIQLQQFLQENPLPQAGIFRNQSTPNSTN